MRKYRVEVTETVVETAVVDVLASSKEDAREKVLQLIEDITLDKEVTYEKTDVGNITEIE